MCSWDKHYEDKANKKNVKVEISQIFITNNFEQSKSKNKVLYEK